MTLLLSPSCSSTLESLHLPSPPPSCSVGVAVYNFYKRATSVDLALPRFNGYLSAAVLPLLMYSAYLGGALVYEMGVG